MTSDSYWPYYLSRWTHEEWKQQLASLQGVTFLYLHSEHNASYCSFYAHAEIDSNWVLSSDGITLNYIESCSEQNPLSSSSSAIPDSSTVTPEDLGVAAASAAQTATPASSTQSTLTGRAVILQTLPYGWTRNHLTQTLAKPGATHSRHLRTDEEAKLGKIDIRDYLKEFDSISPQSLAFTTPAVDPNIPKTLVAISPPTTPRSTTPRSTSSSLSISVPTLMSTSISYPSQLGILGIIDLGDGLNELLVFEDKLCVEGAEKLCSLAEYIRFGFPSLASSNGELNSTSALQSPLSPTLTSSTSTSSSSFLSDEMYAFHLEYLGYQLMRFIQSIHSQNRPHQLLSPSSVLVSSTGHLTFVAPLGSYKLTDTHYRASNNAGQIPNSATNYYPDFSVTSKPRARSSSTPPNVPRPSTFLSLDISEGVKAWIRRDISNLEYILLLNFHCGAVFGDPARHPYIPWVIDFKTETSWRDLSRSKHRINKGDVQLDMEFELNGNHITELLSELTVRIYAARCTSKQILQRVVRSKFEPREYPASIERMYEWTPDEAIPEFFVHGPHPLGSSLFVSQHTELNDLEIPSWAESESDFITKHRRALESDEVSSRLHHWFDLSFGVLLAGTSARKHKNVPLPPGAAHPSRPIVQLFHHPHPPRLHPSLLTPSVLSISPPTAPANTNSSVLQSSNLNRKRSTSSSTSSAVSFAPSSATPLTTFSTPATTSPSGLSHSEYPEPVKRIQLKRRDTVSDESNSLSTHKPSSIINRLLMAATKTFDQVRADYASKGTPSMKFDRFSTPPQALPYGDNGDKFNPRSNNIRNNHDNASGLEGMSNFGVSPPIDDYSLTVDSPLVIHRPHHHPQHHESEVQGDDSKNHENTHSPSLSQEGHEDRRAEFGTKPLDSEDGSEYANPTLEANDIDTPMSMEEGNVKKHLNFDSAPTTPSSSGAARKALRRSVGIISSLLGPSASGGRAAPPSKRSKPDSLDVDSFVDLEISGQDEEEYYQNTSAATIPPKGRLNHDKVVHDSEEVEDEDEEVIFHTLHAPIFPLQSQPSETNAIPSKNDILSLLSAQYSQVQNRSQSFKNGDEDARNAYVIRSEIIYTHEETQWTDALVLNERALAFCSVHSHSIPYYFHSIPKRVLEDSNLRSKLAALWPISTEVKDQLEAAKRRDLLATIAIIFELHFHRPLFTVSTFLAYCNTPNSDPPSTALNSLVPSVPFPADRSGRCKKDLFSLVDSILFGKKSTAQLIDMCIAKLTPNQELSKVYQVLQSFHANRPTQIANELLAAFPPSSSSFERLSPRIKDLILNELFSLLPPEGASANQFDGTEDVLAAFFQFFTWFPLSRHIAAFQTRFVDIIDNVSSMITNLSSPSLNAPVKALQRHSISLTAPPQLLDLGQYLYSSESIMFALKVIGLPFVLEKIVPRLVKIVPIPIRRLAFSAAQTLTELLRSGLSPYVGARCIVLPLLHELWNAGERVEIILHTADELTSALGSKYVTALVLPSVWTKLEASIREDAAPSRPRRNTTATAAEPSLPSSVTAGQSASEQPEPSVPPTAGRFTRVHRERARASATLVLVLRLIANIVSQYEAKEALEAFLLERRALISLLLHPFPSADVLKQLSLTLENLASVLGPSLTRHHLYPYVMQFLELYNTARQANLNNEVQKALDGSSSIDQELVLMYSNSVYQYVNQHLASIIQPQASQLGQQSTLSSQGVSSATSFTSAARRMTLPGETSTRPTTLPMNSLPLTPLQPSLTSTPSTLAVSSISSVSTPLSSPALTLPMTPLISTISPSATALPPLAPWLMQLPLDERGGSDETIVPVRSFLKEISVRAICASPNESVLAAATSRSGHKATTLSCWRMDELSAGAGVQLDAHSRAMLDMFWMQEEQLLSIDPLTLKLWTPQRAVPTLTWHTSPDQPFSAIASTKVYPTCFWVARSNGSLIMHDTRGPNISHYSWSLLPPFRSRTNEDPFVLGITSLSLATGVELLVSAHADGTMRMFDSRMGLTLHSWKLMVGTVSRVKAISQNELLAIRSTVSTTHVELWHVGGLAPQLVRSFTGHRDDVKVAAIGSNLIAGSSKGLSILKGGVSVTSDDLRVHPDVIAVRPARPLAHRSAPVRAFQYLPLHHALLTVDENGQVFASVADIV